MANIAHVLLIEGRGSDSRSFSGPLQEKGYQVTIAKTGRHARELLNAIRPDVIVLDALIYGSSGIRVCNLMRSAAPRIPIIFILAFDSQPPTSVHAQVYLKRPFTVRKLINRINYLMPSAEGTILSCGPIILDLDQRSIQNGRTEQRLTPKQAKLLEILMRHPNQTITRKQLMYKVWMTEYMDDTRTLDVHIRWVRESIEEDPSKPRLLRTVRGKGYYFAAAEED
ncbi:MAG: response regulator transcription factor [Chloroflexota bacterium]